MIIKEDDLSDLRIAGKIAYNAIDFGNKLIKPGVRLVEVLDKIEEFILKEGGNMAFPAQIAINEIAAHFCPLSDDTYVFRESDIIKLDVGVHVNGLIADTARTIIFDSKENDRLSRIKKASEDALATVIKNVRPGATLGELGLIIQEVISRYDLSPVKNLSGHGLGKYSVHEPPTVPNFSSNDKTELSYNQLIAIEPFATDGQGMIYESSNSTLFSISKTGSVRSNMTREVLRDIQEFKGLPFTTRWLSKKHGVSKVNYALNELKKMSLLHEYPPLIEARKGFVSQSEHTVIVRDTPIVTTRMHE